MKLLIIGSKGFIGKNAYNYFSEQGHDVYGCDVSVDYNDSQYFQIDATNSDFHTIFQNHPFTLCINCSGAASVPQSLQSPLRDFNLNTANVMRILEAIREYQPNCKLINLSSAAVYGNPIKLPINETDSIAPISPYGLHKVFAENICREYNEYFGIKTCSVRIFSAFGNGLQKQLIWDLYQKFSKNEEILLFGTGNETRDFIHIVDILRALELIAEKGNFQADVINIANGQEITINEISKIFAHAMSSDKKIIFNNQEKEGDPKNWKADIQKLKDLGYKQTVGFEEGIKNYIEWAKENA